MRTVVVTGSASGMGAATKARLESAGQRVIGVDLREADVVADLGTVDGRDAAIAAVEERADGSIDGLVTWAGLSGLTKFEGSLLASVNYFGSVALLEGLRPLLALGDRPAAVAVSSNSTTNFPGVPMDLVDLLLAGDEAAARAAADAVGSLATYPASKLAIAYWARRQATTDEWAGAGITLNVVAPGVVETPLLQASRDDPTIGPFVDAFPVPLGRRRQPTSWRRSSSSCSVPTRGSSAARSCSSTGAPTPCIAPTTSRDRWTSDLRSVGPPPILTRS